MACSDQVSPQDLENAKKDAVTLGEVATSKEGAVPTGAIIDQTTNRFGDISDTVNGRLKKMGYAVPVGYAAGILFETNDNVKTVEESGIVYAPLPSSLPFTTTGTWGVIGVSGDNLNFFVAQGVTNEDLDDRIKRLNPYTILDAINSIDIKLGDVLNVRERSTGNGGGAIWDVVLASTVTPNTFDVVQCVGEPTLALVLRIDGAVRADQLGLAASNSAADNSLVLTRLTELAEANILTIELPSGAFNFVGPWRFNSPSFDWTFNVFGQGLKETKLVNTATDSSSGLEIRGTSGNESVWSSLKKFLITGNASSGDGIFIDLAGRVDFEEVEASDNGENGIYCLNSWAPSFYRCRGDRNTLSGLRLEGGSNNKINGARVEGGAYSSNGEDGIFIQAANDDDTDSGAVINVGLSNNGRNGIWATTPLIRIHECFPEFNRGAQIKIGNSADARILAGAELTNNFIDARNISGPDYQGVVVEESRGVFSRNNNFKNVVSAHEVDATSTFIEVGFNRYAGSVTNALDLGGSLYTDKLREFRVKFETTEINAAPTEVFDMLGSSTGDREDVTNAAASPSNPVKRWQLNGATLFGFRQDGRMIMDGAIPADGSPSTIQNKIEIFNAAGASLGWVPIYDNF